MIVVLRPVLPPAQPAFLDDRDVLYAVALAKVIGRGQPMPASADDYHIVGFARLWAGPGAAPAGMLAERFAGDGKRRNSVSWAALRALAFFWTSGDACGYPETSMFRTKTEIALSARRMVAIRGVGDRPVTRFFAFACAAGRLQNTRRIRKGRQHDIWPDRRVWGYDTDGRHRAFGARCCARGGKPMRPTVMNAPCGCIVTSWRKLIVILRAVFLSRTRPSAPKLEVQRRILELDRTARGDLQGAASGSRIAVLGVVAVALLGAVGVYWSVGVPNYPDMPLVQRHAEAQRGARQPSASGPNWKQAMPKPSPARSIFRAVMIWNRWCNSCAKRLLPAQRI